MATTVGALAGHLGRTKDDVLDACRRVGVVAWSEHTPLDDAEAQRVTEALQAPFATPPGGGFGPPPPPAPEPYGGFPAYQPAPSQVSSGRRSTAWRVPVLVVAVVIGLAVARPLVAEQDREREQQEELRDAFGNIDLDDIGALDPGAASPEAGGRELVLGDCWNDLTAADQTAEVIDVNLAEVPCADPHDAEVYAVFDHEAGNEADFPGDQALSDYAAERCVDQFSPFVGRDIQSSALDVTFVFPSENGWRLLNDREISCSVVDYVPEGETAEQLVGSMAGTGR